MIIANDDDLIIQQNEDTHKLVHHVITRMDHVEDMIQRRIEAANEEQLKKLKRSKAFNINQVANIVSAIIAVLGFILYLHSNIHF